MSLLALGVLTPYSGLGSLQGVSVPSGGQFGGVFSTSVNTFPHNFEVSIVSPTFAVSCFLEPCPTLVFQTSLQLNLVWFLRNLEAVHRIQDKELALEVANTFVRGQPAQLEDVAQHHCHLAHRPHSLDAVVRRAHWLPIHHSV